MFRARRPVCAVIVYYYCCAFVRARIMYCCISIREEGNSLPEGTATAAQQFRVYLPRPVVGHRVAQATALPSGGGAEAPFGVVAVADQVL